MFLSDSGCKDTTKSALCQYIIPKYFFRADYQTTNVPLFFVSSNAVSR